MMLSNSRCFRTLLRRFIKAAYFPKSLAETRLVSNFDSAFGATTGQDFASIVSSHASTEPCHVAVFDFRRLICFSHTLFPPRFASVRIDYSFLALPRQRNITRVCKKLKIMSRNHKEPKSIHIGSKTPKCDQIEFSTKSVNKLSTPRL
jgi:hypothetical protein